MGLSHFCLGQDGWVSAGMALTGLGSGGVPDLTQPGNLGALAFHWLGNVDWPTMVDPDALTLYQNILVKPDELGFFNNPTVTQQSITGALSAVTDPNAKAVLTSIIDALADNGYNLVVNDTT